jgi:hypothetical protein
VHQNRPGVYQKFRSLGQPSGVSAGMSGDTGGWETDSSVVGLSEMGRTATGPDVFLLLVMTVKLALISRPYE